MPITLLLLFIIGLCFGSFTNVLIDRIPRGKSIFFGRSKCEKCHKQIRNYDLIPVVSYLVLQGKCRSCHARISPRVFFVELFSGIFFVFVFLFPLTTILSYILICALILVLLAIAIIDIDHGIIQDSLLGVFGILGLFFILQTSSSILLHILSGIIAFVFFLGIFLITRGRGIGFGDVKFAFFIGFLLSFQQLIIAMYVAFLTGAVISIILVIVRKKKMHGSTIPFGPFLSLGVVAALLFEKQILVVVLPFLGLK